LGKLLERLLQGLVRLLSSREVVRLQVLTQLLKFLADRTLSASTPMMVASRCLTFGVLLNLGVVLLGSRKVPRLKILRKLVELLGDRIRALR
jgi:hypothetical protein